MKKFAFLAIAALFTTSMFAQSLSLDKSSETVYGGPEDELISHVAVTNQSGSPVDIKVRRSVLQNFTNNDLYFCWDVCYDPTVNGSLQALSIGSQVTNTDFKGYSISDPGAAGTAIVKYCFFNTANQADSACYTVTYVVDATSVNEATALKFTNPYPNPANDNVNFNYTLPNTNRATVKVYNMLGALVKTANITDTTGKLSINTTDLRPGLYLYDLQVSGKSMKTGKFTVAQ